MARSVYSSFGAVLRGELDGSQLENVAVNFRNPYEVCVNSFGEAFLSDNDNDGNESARICWIMEGGDYGWFGGPPFAKQDLAARLPASVPFREHWHFRGHIPGYVPATLVTGFGSPTRHLPLRERRLRADVQERAAAHRRRPARVPRLSHTSWWATACGPKA